MRALHTPPLYIEKKELIHVAGYTVKCQEPSKSPKWTSCSVGQFFRGGSNQKRKSVDEGRRQELFSSLSVFDRTPHLVVVLTVPLQMPNFC